MKVEALKHIKHYLENVNKKYGFVFSWIGLRKSDYTVFPLISSKENEDYLKYVKLRWDDSPYGNAPVGMAIKTAKIQYSNDMLNDKRFEPVYEILKKKNFLSIIAIPLFKEDNKVFGVFAGYSDKTGFFSEKNIYDISKDIENINQELVKIYKDELQIEEKISEYLSILYDIITYINKGTASNIDPKYLTVDVLNDLDKLLNADGSEFIIYNKTDNKVEMLVGSDLFLENFSRPSFDLEMFGGLSPFVRHYMEKEHTANIDYEHDPYASKWYIEKGLKFINSTSINTYIYDKDTACMLILARKNEILISETELNILKLINQALFSIFVTRKYLTDIDSLHIHLEEIATKDPLTGFYNKDMFDMFLENEVKKSAVRMMPNAFSYILIDIDNFKYINDAYGYQAGDMVIKELSNILKSSTRASDILARIGGDEFGIIAPDTKVQSAKVIMERINERLSSQPIILEDKKIYISLSVGISTCFEKEGQSLLISGFSDDDNTQNKRLSKAFCSKEEVKMLAEEALKKAKKSGKSSVVIASFEDNDIEYISKYELINNAINGNLIKPAFQPIFDLEDKKIIGFEALCRIEINNNIIYPDQFIEEAEDLGLINKIDLLMIRKACERISALNKKINSQDGLRLFVNISAKAFKDRRFFQDVVDIAKEYDMQNKLYIEITERESLSNLEKFEEIEEFLKYYGIHFVIDDFGSGYSSFLYLKFIKTEILKIDGAFVKNIVKNERDRAIVNGINIIAKHLNTKTLAEFIEDEETLDELMKIGVNYGQGYYLGKPTFDLEKFFQ
ncbi:MAG: EAL domain-containing protein [Hydrogenobaculum sp.]